MKLLVRNGRVVDPASGMDAVLDVLLDGPKIAALGPRLECPGADVFDASGLVVAPGFIDMHVHLREPGQTRKETIETGTRAAIRGGFTSVAAMPNTDPPNDDPGVTAFILDKARKAAIHVFPIGALTRGLRGEEPADLSALAAAGAVAFSDDGRCIPEARIMRRVMETARDLGRPVIDHCEDRSLFGSGVVNEGPMSRRLGLPGIPAAAEDVIVARDLILAEDLGADIHIAHISTRRALRMVREAKRRGVRVTAEATPHHLLLTEEALESRDPNFKMNPPLRAREDMDALTVAIQDGTVDAFATDHAPHTAAEKAAGLEKAPFGVIGLETAVALLLDRLVRPGLLPLGRFVAMWTLRPAEILKLPSKGRLSAGADADLTLLDLESEAVVDASRFASLSRNTPFQGWTLRGGPAATIVAGRVVFASRT